MEKQNPNQVEKIVDPYRKWAFGSKQKQIIKILWLRLQSKANKVNKIGTLYGQIQLLLSKYEILACLSYPQKIYLSIKINQSVVVQYNIGGQFLYNYDADVRNFLTSKTRIIQINNSDMVISGGDDDRFTLFSGDKSEERGLIQERAYHGLAIDNQLIFFISGYQSNWKNEVFDLQQKVSSLIPHFEKEISSFGLALTQSNLITFGGISGLFTYSQEIFTFDKYLNE